MNIRKMFCRVIAVARHLRCEVHAKVDPIGYARKIGVTIGENVNFYGMRCTMFGTEPWLITIGNNVYITSGCAFVTHDGGTLILRNEVADLEWTAPISIGNDVYIGIRTLIMPGVKIGNRVIIGAGAIVTRDIPNNSVAVGSPARVVKSVDEYLEQMKRKSLKCGHLKGIEKEAVLKKIFGITTSASMLK